MVRTALFYCAPISSADVKSSFFFRAVYARNIAWTFMESLYSTDDVKAQHGITVMRHDMQTQSASTVDV